MFLESLDEASAAGPAARISVWTAAALDVAQTVGRQSEGPTGVAPRVGGSSQRQASMITSDIRAAWRSLIRQKFATGLAIGMLALGIAASVAVFTLVNGIFLRPFPGPGTRERTQEDAVDQREDRYARGDAEGEHADGKARGELLADQRTPGGANVGGDHGCLPLR